VNKKSANIRNAGSYMYHGWILHFDCILIVNFERDGRSIRVFLAILNKVTAEVYYFLCMFANIIIKKRCKQSTSFGLFDEKTTEISIICFL
jgi:hypothetical protein